MARDFWIDMKKTRMLDNVTVNSMGTDPVFFSFFFFSSLSPQQPNYLHIIGTQYIFVEYGQIHVKVVNLYVKIGWEADSFVYV